MDEYIKEIERDLNNDKKFLKVRSNNLMLSDYQVDILDKYCIEWVKCSSIRDILFLIDEYLDQSIDESDDLEEIAYDLQDLSYYTETRK